MLCFVIALAEEAQPIIRYYGLRQQSRFRFRYYESDQACVIISGTGKIACATATTLLLSSIANLDRVFLINYGIAAASPIRPIGSLWLINKVSDWTTGKNVYPDLIWKTEIPEAPLLTVEKPLKKILSHHDFLYDMEAFAFYQSAIHFINTHQIMIFKTVSDHGTADYIDRNLVDTLNEKTNSIMLNAVEKAYTTMLQNTPPRITLNEEIIENIRRSLRLTETQYYMLINAARAYKIRHGRDFDFSTLQHFPRHAQDRNRMFRNLLHELNS